MLDYVESFGLPSVRYGGITQFITVIRGHLENCREGETKKCDRVGG